MAPAEATGGRVGGSWPQVIFSTWLSEEASASTPALRRTASRGRGSSGLPVGCFSPGGSQASLWSPSIFTVFHCHEEEVTFLEQTRAVFLISEGKSAFETRRCKLVIPLSSLAASARAHLRSGENHLGFHHCRSTLRNHMAVWFSADCWLCISGRKPWLPPGSVSSAEKAFCFPEPNPSSYFQRCI